jgi:hypothetical protein
MKLVHVLTEPQWAVLRVLLKQIKARTNGGALAAVLVAPVAARRYEERTGGHIDDTGGALAYEFDPPDLMLDLVRPRDVKFADDEFGDAEPYVVQCVLETQGLCGDGRTELKAYEE